MEKIRPRSPAEPRPEKKPSFISPQCPRCGADLALADRVERMERADDEIWHDEWMCPVCRDRIYLDVPGGLS